MRPGARGLHGPGAVRCCDSIGEAGRFVLRYRLAWPLEKRRYRCRWISKRNCHKRSRHAGVDSSYLATSRGPTPRSNGNVHRVEVVSDSASFSMSIENVPSDNPKTGRITALSVISYLRKLGAPLRVGSWWIDSQAAPIRPRQRRPQQTPCFVPEPRRTAPWCIRAGARQKPPTSCPVRR
jgi:hypothetical protein